MKNLPSETVDYTIFNTLGKVVAAGSSCGTIPVAALEQGIYFLQIMGENYHKTVKFIVK